MIILIFTTNSLFLIYDHPINSVGHVQKVSQKVLMNDILIEIPCLTCVVEWEHHGSYEECDTF